MNTSLELLTAYAEAIGWALLHSLWQGAIVAAVLFIALGLLRRRSAAVRHAACLLALLALVIVTARTAWLLRPAPAARVSATTIIATTATTVSMPPLPSISEPATLAPVSPDTFEPAAVAATPLLSWRERLELWVPWISAVWVFGVLGCSLRHCGGWWRVRALRRRGEIARPEWQQTCARLAARFGLRQGARLLESSAAAGPMLAGLFKPVILLPARLATGLTATELEAILAHELAHLARRDAWSNFAQLAIETVFFYHPAVWWIGNRTRQEREHAADDLALRVCADRRLYAGALTRLAELQLVPSPALAATGGNLLARIRRIVQPAQPESALTGWNAGVPALLTLLAAAAVFAARADDAKIIAVAPGESIQAAIDAAPNGAVIRLSAGEWKERIVISKPLTIEGAGWDKTLLRPDQPDPAYKTARAEMMARAEAVQSPEEKQKIYREADNLGEPTISVHGTTGAVIRKIKIQGIAPGSEVKDGLHSLMLVKIENGRATISDCALTEYHCGVLVWAGGDVKIERTLVAAMWNLGVGAGKGGKVHIHESELRNCHYAGLVIGSGAEAAVERSRISGAAWHGIRADDASLRLSGSAIFGNEAAGLYIDGKTSAVVRENLFHKNGGALWMHAGECEIEQNTFAENRRGDLSFDGTAKVRVRQNLFASGSVGISLGFSAMADSVPSSPPVLQRNAFWRIETPMIVSTRDGKTNQENTEEKQSAPADSLAVDPKFRDAANADFTLAVDSPVRAAHIGAAEPLAPAGPWFLLEEEKAIIPVDDTREERFWTYPGTAKRSKVAEQAARQSADDAKSWVEDAFQLDDKAKREAAIERVRAAMNSGDVNEARTGITAFTRLGPIEFDKASFRPAVRRLLASADATTRAAAASAFYQTGTEPEDLPRIFALADDPAAEIRDVLTGVIVAVTKRDLTGEAPTNAILKLMDKLPRDSRSVAHAMWGVKLSPDIEARVLEFCREIDHASNSSVGYNFFYGTLSTQANKSEASCKRLIELLAHPDTTNIAGRSAWGLQQGVDRAQYPLVADAMVKVIEARSDGYLRNNALRCLRTYGNAAQAPAIRALLAKPGVTGEIRKALDDTLAELEARPVADSAALPSPENQPSKPNDPESMKLNNATLRNTAAALALATGVGTSELSAEETTALREKVAALEKRIAELEGAGSNERKLERLREENKQKARQRGAEDRKHYKPEELAEIESLYQVANKNWRTDEARTSLKKLLEKYDRANRTGCATLYMGQMSEGQERIDYLTRAVEKFSDCYYFDGCQVGGYGRYVLALTLWEKGDKDKARTLLAELKTTYKDATDHRGRPMGEVAEAAEKELAAKQ